MKILQINKFLKIVGGAETYMFQLSKSLQDFGIDVRFWGMEDSENIVHDFPALEAANVDYTDQNLINITTPLCCEKIASDVLSINNSNKPNMALKK